MAKRASGGGTLVRVEAIGYRSLRYVSQQLNKFHVLVGPNASGKSTFLDVPAFLGDLQDVGLEAAIHGDARLEIPFRAPDPQQLTWMRQQNQIELAVEFGIPEDLTNATNGSVADTCRYEVAIDVNGPLRLIAENLWIKPSTQGSTRQRKTFPTQAVIPGSIVHPARKPKPRNWKKILSRSDEPERVMFHSETSGWKNPFRLGTERTALSSLPDDRDRFPVATWFRMQLAQGVQRVVLSSEKMRESSPPGRSKKYSPDGSNLPHVIHSLEIQSQERHRDWVRHVQEALPDIEDIFTREREDDKHRYLVVRYSNGLAAPSWLVSDGTLRLLALTLLAYLPDATGIYLIEEPENGIHPKGVETVYQSLSSLYRAQALLASHSPVIASMANLEDIICFARTKDGATDMVPGIEHPKLRSWRGSLDLGTLLAAGVLE